jgi:hypothetical protein
MFFRRPCFRTYAEKSLPQGHLKPSSDMSYGTTEAVHNKAISQLGIAESSAVTAQ